MIMAVVAILWIWLVVFIFLRTTVTLINIIWVVISGVIIFVPLYKKYFQNRENE